MKEIFKKSIFCCVIFSFAVLNQACQPNSTNDTTKQEMDRQNGVADTVEAQYTKMKGQFTGKYNNCDILLNLNVARQNSAGNGDLNLVPQPTLIGSFTLTPQIFATTSGQPLTIPYSVTAGQYSSRDILSLTVQQNSTSTTMQCKVANESQLDCLWYANASTGSVVELSLNRVLGTDSTASRNRVGDTYVGSNTDYQEIKAQFRTVLSPQAGSIGVPMVSIAGSISFNNINFNFSNAQYDPISNIIAINIAGDSPIIVNCLIKTLSSLHCTWVGTHGKTSYEDFDLRAL